jgi:hypothetical protein
VSKPFKYHERGIASEMFFSVFGVMLNGFLDPMMTKLNLLTGKNAISIDVFKFDDFLHREFGDYESQNKSMNDIVLENYGEKGMDLLNRLLCFDEGAE